MGFKTLSPFKLNDNFFDQIGRQWMLITAAKPDGTVNSMTAAWGGIGFIWQQPVCFFFIRPQRCTKTFVQASPTLSLSFYSSDYRDALNFMGNVSGFDDAEKASHSGLTLAFYEAPATDEMATAATAAPAAPATDEMATAGTAATAAPAATVAPTAAAPAATATDGAATAAARERTPYFSEARLVFICERLYQQDMRAEGFIDQEQLKRWYTQIDDGAFDLHTLYIAGIRDVLVSD
jgi:flavin reductase (DIM6/NTAB) family NADH-FMN oxidoreductase RutF